MKIEARKITSNPRKFSLDLIGDNYKINAKGNLSKLSNGLIKIDSTITGEMDFVCDISGDDFKKSINDDVVLFVKDGIWDSHKNRDYFDVVEFFDGYIDLEFIFRSELESMQLDYHIK